MTKLKIQLNSNLIKQEQFLNKHLNFVPTKTKYNKRNLNDIESFYRRVKLTTHFGINDTKKKQTKEE